MDEQQNQTTTANTDDTGPDDSEPTPERQAELRKMYEANVTVGKPPYAGVLIGTQGELAWIIRERGWKPESDARTRSDLPDLRNTGISGDLRQIDLAAFNLCDAWIFDANLSEADLTGTDLSRSLVTNYQSEDQLPAFDGANLVGANLSNAFVGANFRGADLTVADLRGTTITGDLRGANLTRSRMDSGTIFGGYGESGKILIDTNTRLLDVSWNGAILALVNWDQAPRLGDEILIRAANTRSGRVHAYQDAARAYLGLAKALEAQGLSAPALRYRRRQHQLERAAQLRSFNLLGWLFSSALNIVSGYGDRPLRALGIYLAVILAFAGVYFGITTPSSPIFFSGSQPLQLHEAVVFSMSSFHGRGFFPSTIGLGDPVAIVAALEAVVGLFIELVLIATFTRRLFER